MRFQPRFTYTHSTAQNLGLIDSLPLSWRVLRRGGPSLPLKDALAKGSKQGAPSRGLNWHNAGRGYCPSLL